MTIQKYSPNWYWNFIGADIFRNGLIRTIYINGVEVCHKAGYETELSIARWLTNADESVSSCPESLDKVQQLA